MRGKTAEDHRLLELLDPLAEASGFEIVRLRLTGAQPGRRLQILAQREDGSMPVEDCAALARAISPIMDAADPIGGGYLLEVSSPGIDRPLTRLGDFAAYAGCEARLEVERLVDGRKRFRGVLAGVDGGRVALVPEGETDIVCLPFSSLVEAKLVMTDTLLKRGAEARAARIAAEHSPTVQSHDQEDTQP